MSVYDWKGSEFKWELREIFYLMKCLKEKTRTEAEVWLRINEIVRGEKHR